jgi:quercetin dioxygenase-like cupin family protein
MVMAAESNAAAALHEPTHMIWQAYRRNFALVTPEGKGWGHQRIEYPAIHGTDFFGHWTALPAAQSAISHTASGDVVYLSVEGEIEFTVDGVLYPLKPLDLLSVPAHMPRSYVNVGLKNALFFGTYAKNQHGPSMIAADARVELMSWENSRRDFHWTLPLAERWGYHRGSGPLIRPPMLRGHLVRDPAAQSTPWHYAPRDMMFTVIDNEVEFAAAGKCWPLKPMDMLVLPAGTPYKYTNYSRMETLFFSIGGMLPPGKKGVYFSADPGWPIRPDAPTMQVEIDPYGDARVISGAPKD